MSEYQLPEGMTAEKLREAIDCIRRKEIGTATDMLRSLVDAIDPPEPVSIVTDEMVVKLQRSLGVTSDVPLSAYRTWLKAVEKLGWLRTAAKPSTLGYRDVVFDGPPSAVAGRFIEVEDESGASTNDLGVWLDRGDECWALRVPHPQCDGREADAIDPPEPESAVTDEMVEAVAVEIRPEDIGRDAWLTLGILKEILKAVERLGWLRTESETLIDWERMFGFLQEDLDTASDENRRLAAENNDLRKRVHDLESAADNPSLSVGPWPTDEQVNAAAPARWERMQGAGSYQQLDEDVREQLEWRERAALEAVAPPPADGRLAMAEGLLRRASMPDTEVGPVAYGHGDRHGERWWVLMTGDDIDITPAEADYLRSLDGEGESDE